VEATSAAAGRWLNYAAPASGIRINVSSAAATSAAAGRWRAYAVPASGIGVNVSSAADIAD